MFIAMNNFKVVAGKEEEFERIWKTRETYLQGVPGFLRFALLRGDAPGEYVSHSTWQDRDAFTAWTQSDAFVAGHRQGTSLMGVLAGPPAVKLYDAVLSQEAGAPATA
ncbi:MAG TPA: antibiotic biosynthesis monooxygenase [Dehalococcoidia bacterium]|nr:antibiotic biosynthesis monooxygenase [Dehalococcoidia bacterium]